MADCQPIPAVSNSVFTWGGFKVPAVLNCSVNLTSMLSSTSPTDWPNYDDDGGPSPRYNLVHLFVTSVILGIIILATIIGNVFVIAAIVLERNLQNVANYLIASLAVADLMVAALVMPLAVVNEVSLRWFLGREACDAFVLFDVICCTASILHLVAISLDRYWAVSRVDYIHNRSARRILTMIAVSWSVSALISVPPLFGDRDPLHDVERTGICLISQDWGYTVFSTIGAFYLPLLAMFVIYARIYRTARSRIRKHNFRRGPHSSAAGLVVAAAERLRDGTAACGGVVENSPTPQPLLGKMFFRPLATLDRRQKTPSTSGSTAAKTNNCVGIDETTSVLDYDDATLQSTGNRFAPTPMPPPPPSRNGRLLTESIDEDVGSASATIDEEDRSMYCPATAVSNACSIIIAAASATPQQQQQQSGDDGDASRSPEITPTPPSSADIRSPPIPFFVRFLDRRAGWLSMTTAARVCRARPGYRQQLSSSSDVGFFPVGNVDSDEVSTTYVTSSSTGNHRGAASHGAGVPLPVATAAASRRAREKQEQKRERKATRTLAVVTGTFVGCWLPFFILALVRPFCGDRCHYPPLLVSVIAWLGYVNSLLNPVIYTIFNPDFRSAFRKILFGKYRSGGSAWRHGQMHALQHLPFARR